MNWRTCWRFGGRYLQAEARKVGARAAAYINSRSSNVLTAQEMGEPVSRETVRWAALWDCCVEKALRSSNYPW